MNTLGIILARAGSKGLPDKCVRPLLGKPLIEHTFAHAAASRRLSDFLLTTDSDPAKALARSHGVRVVDRPAELATDTATVDSAARHAVEHWERETGRRADVVVLLYGNIPVRRDDLIDRAVDHLVRSGADSVRSVAPVSKQHPDWIHRLDGDRMTQFRVNSIHRRQDLEPLFYHDGAVVAVTREALFAAAQTPEDRQSFLGRDRRAIVQRCDDAVDVDEPVDLLVAEAILRARDKAREPSRQRFSNPRDVEAPRVALGSRRVGRSEGLFVIAEAGVNHNGSPQTALQMVDAAVDAGADAVKFQMFRADDLVTAKGGLAAYQRRGGSTGSQREMLRSVELRADAFRRVKTHCDQRGILFLATPFGEREVAELVDLGAAAIKIASTDLTNDPLTAAAARSGLPMIVSVGAATAAEIRRAVGGLLETIGRHRLILMHCVSCYPTPLASANLRAIGELQAEFGVPCGFSDHTLETITGAAAVASGACILEKHFTLDRAAPGPDHAMSLHPGQLREYIARAREVHSAMGRGGIGLSPIESDVRRVAGRSVVAASDISAGTILTDELLCLKRPGGGLEAAALAELVGRRAVAAIPSDTPLTWDMVR